jgi:tetratricopeptide (TPR) repeat protein
LQLLKVGRLGRWAAMGIFASIVFGSQAGMATSLPGCMARTAAEWTACGDDAVNDGRYDDAMAAYAQALTLDPRSWEALNNRGTLATGLGDNEAAIKDFDQALAIAPDHCSAICFNRATAYYQAQEFPEAIADYSAVLKQAPGDDQALFRRGVCYRIIGDNEAALRDFADVIRLRPDNVGAYSNRASIYAGMGHDDAARQEDERALAIDSTYADAYYDRAGIAYRRKDFQNAVADYAEAILFYAEAAEGPSERVSHWFWLGDYAQPLKPGGSERRIDLYLADAYYWRSLAYRALGDSTKADGDLADARRIDPNVATRAGDLP